MNIITKGWIGIGIITVISVIVEGVYSKFGLNVFIILFTIDLLWSAYESTKKYKLIK